MLLYNFCEIITANVVINQKNTENILIRLTILAQSRYAATFGVKEENAPPDVEYLIGHELLPVRPGRSDPRKVRPTSHISFLYRAA